MNRSAITSPRSSGAGQSDSLSSFRSRNSGLAVLPKDILCSESRIKEALQAIEAAPLSLAEKMRAIEEQELTPFLTGSRIKPEFGLLIEVGDELDRLDIFKIKRAIAEDELNGKVQVTPADRELLVQVKDPRLIFSARALYESAVDASERESAAQLFTLGKRITTYRGVTVTWDQSVDRKVWTTNIDTVYYINCLHHDGVFARDDIRSALEIGVGGGAISKTLLAKLKNLNELTATDISAYALMCGKRNILPELRPGQTLNLYLGKGVRTIDAAVDILLVNPPYIPHMLKPDAVDPYRGTGLIKEILEVGVSRLNPNNPRAAIYMGMSSLAARDLAEYLKEAKGIKVEVVGKPLSVPLKILDVNSKRDWIEFLKKEHGLVDSGPAKERTGFQYWHEISVLKIQRAP